MNAWRFVLVLMIALTVACGKKEPSADEALKQYRSKVEPKLANAEAIGKALPAIKEEAVKLDGPPPTLTQIIGFTDRSQKQMGNATLVYASDLADVTTLGKVDFRVDNAEFQNVLNQCGALLRKGTAPKDSFGKTVEHGEALYLQVCADLKYLIVLKPTTLEGPTTNTKTKVFTPGVFRGEVLFFNLDTRAFLGGFSLNFTQRGDSDGETITTQESDLPAAVRGRFLGQIRYELNQALKKHAGALPKAAW